jgi:hypothetical protein
MNLIPYYTQISYNYMIFVKKSKLFPAKTYGCHAVRVQTDKRLVFLAFSMKFVLVQVFINISKTSYS